jgi:subtilisin
MDIKPQFPLHRRPTGNTLVVFKEGARPEATSMLNAVTGRGVKTLADMPGFQVHAALDAGDTVYYDRLGIAVVPANANTQTYDAAAMTSLAASDSVLFTRPEYYMFALQDVASRYVSWVRDGLHLLADTALASPAAFVPGTASAASGFEDTAEMTWGLQAIGCGPSTLTGKGIRICVLDTGFDLVPVVPPNVEQRHPDFAGRVMTYKSFVPGEAITDLQGHGTHCIGTAAGARAGADHPRYGVAPDAEIFAGKVLDNRGSGAEAWILAGIEWAIEQKCEVISMSLGRPVAVGEAPDPLYESTGQRALDHGCLIIAAAGNDSNRGGGYVAPVGAPANSESIMAVAAVDSSLRVAGFSNGGINPAGGEVDISAPGVAVFSSYPRPQGYKRMPGTSMAAPHVAGAAALWAQSDPSLRGAALWSAVVRSARELGSKKDFGYGLVQVPGASPVS